MNRLSTILAAEFLGTAALVLFGAGAVCADRFLRAASQPDLGPLGIALAYGASYGSLVAALGRLSEGYFNPAVAVGRWVTRRLGTFRAVACILAELAGAAAAAYLLRAAIPEDTWRAAALGTPQLATGVTRAPGMLIEGAGAFVVVLLLLATAFQDRQAASGFAGMVAGLATAAGLLFALPFTGGSLNPARAFGPALAARQWANHGVYWVGPLLGGVLAASIHDALLNRPSRPS